MPRRSRPDRPRRPSRLKLPRTHGTYRLPDSTEQQKTKTASENDTNTKENKR